MDALYYYLKRHGACLSSDLANWLVDKQGISAEAARKQISRRDKQQIKCLDSLKFPRNEKFLYLKQDYGSPTRFWRKLTLALKRSNSCYGFALDAIRARGGIIPEAHFYIASGSPLEQKKHISVSVIIESLIKAGLIHRLEVPEVGNCLSLSKETEYLEQAIADMRARLIIEKIMLAAFKDWARKLALGSYDKFELRTMNIIGLPRVGTFSWDLTAPSYLSPLVGWTTKGKVKQGFLACDILLGKELSESNFQPFVKKCDGLRSLKNVGNCLQIFIADRYSQQALDCARKKGIIPATPQSLFGKDVALALTSLINILSHAAKNVVDPEKLQSIFDQLGKFEGAKHLVQGILFEYVVADIQRKSVAGSNIEMNREFKENGKTLAEVDVIVEIQRKSVKFIECKGYAGTIQLPDEEVKKWLERIQVVRRHARQHSDWKNLELEFELWNTGKISSGGLKMISEFVTSTKCKIYHVNSTNIKKAAKELNDPTINKILGQHYFSPAFLE